jgi:hypothetical protein
MSDLATPIPYRDRSAGLILIGLLEIGLALLCLLMLAFVGMATLSLSTMPEAGAAGGSPKAMLAGAAFYLLIGVFFGVMGVGTLRGRRWARSIMLVISWMWLVIGLFSMIVGVIILPKMMAAMSAGTSADPSMSTAMTGCILVVLGLLYIVLPGILVLFYRGPNVKATFEAKDPSIPWTDRVPLPVLALTLVFGFGAASSLLGLTYRAFPVFGRMLTGIPAALAFLAVGALCAFLAWGTYHRRPAAWWGLVATWILGCVNGAFLLLGGGAGLRRMYVAMDTPEIQMQQMERMGIYDIWTNPVILTLMVVVWLGWLGFLIWVKRYFTVRD